MLFVAFPDSGVLGLRHERIALLPRHGCESAAFLPADLVEDDLGELAFGCALCRLGPNSELAARASGCRSLDRRLLNALRRFSFLVFFMIASLLGLGRYHTRVEREVKS